MMSRSPGPGVYNRTDIVQDFVMSLYVFGNILKIDCKMFGIYPLLVLWRA